MTRRRSSLGSIGRLASGQFQARYRVAGVEYPASRTFRTKRDASPRAALIYQHATDERDRAIAEALSQLIAASAAPDSAEVLSLPIVKSP